MESIKRLSGTGVVGGILGSSVGSISTRTATLVTSSPPGYLLLGLLAVLLAVETFSELPQVQALVNFFGSGDPLSDEDQAGILGQDELAMSTQSQSSPAPEQAPAC